MNISPSSEESPLLPGMDTAFVQRTPPPAIPQLEPSEPRTATPSVAPGEPDIKKLLAKIGSLPTADRKYKACEAQILNHRRLLAEGAGRTLLGAVLLALILRDRLYESLLADDGSPRFKKATDFCAAQLTEWGIGASKSRVSYLRRAGALYLALADEELPLPGAAESLVILSRRGKHAPDDWRILVDQAGGGVPTLQAVVDYVEAKRAKGGKPKKSSAWALVEEWAAKGLGEVQKGNAAQAGEILDRIAQLARNRGKEGK